MLLASLKYATCEPSGESHTPEMLVSNVAISTALDPSALATTSFCGVVKPRRNATYVPDFDHAMALLLCELLDESMSTGDPPWMPTISMPALSASRTRVASGETRYPRTWLWIWMTPSVSNRPQRWVSLSSLS